MSTADSSFAPTSIPLFPYKASTFGLTFMRSSVMIRQKVSLFCHVFSSSFNEIWQFNTHENLSSFIFCPDFLSTLP